MQCSGRLGIQTKYQVVTSVDSRAIVVCGEHENPDKSTLVSLCCLTRKGWRLRTTTFTPTLPLLGNTTPRNGTSVFRDRLLRTIVN